MPKQFTPKVVTANHLLEGDVIYQTATGWTRRLSEAELLEGMKAWKKLSDPFPSWE